MPRLSSRTETFTESVIRHMTRVANEHGAINLSQGFPDFDPPKKLTERLSQVALDGRISMRSHGVRRIFARRSPKSMSISRG